MSDKILGSETPAPSGNEKGWIPGAGTPAPPGATGYIPGADEDADRGDNENQAAFIADSEEDISTVTKQGGLVAVPKSFEDKNGNWNTILSDNPFEVLFIDYKLLDRITPEMVKKNFDILSVFWLEKSRLMTGGAREKIKNRYGEDTVNDSFKKLGAAFDKIKSKEGIVLYYDELNTTRYKNGIKSIEELIDAVLAGGELRKEQAVRIIAKGIKSGLEEKEVRAHLHDTLIKNSFKPRSTKKYEDVFDGKWMTDEQTRITQARATDWLGTTVSTLEEVGEVTYYNKEKAYQRISNANYLPVVVTQLTNADKGFEFEEIITNEKDIDRRYLKILYHLNAYLPFRMDNAAFTNISQIFDMSFNDYDLYSKAFSSYQKGHLHIWLNESDPVNAGKLPAGFDYKSFLTFLYQVNNRHPFYLKTERFDTPEQLIKKALNDKSIWISIAEALTKGHIPLWFEGIGKHHWVAQYNAATESFIDSDYYNDDDKKMAAVQSLIQVVNAYSTLPRITSQPNHLKLLTIEGSRNSQHFIILKLENQGFVKAKINLDKQIDGIRIHQNTATFHSQAGMIENKITLEVEATKLVKNKIYSLNVFASTPYEKLTVPVDIKVVFPQKTFLIYLLKYAFFAALFFGGIRFITGFVTGGHIWMSNQYERNGSMQVPPEYFYGFILAFILLIAGIISSIFIIRKIEKI